jgi:hypothetical protein
LGSVLCAGTECIAAIIKQHINPNLLMIKYHRLKLSRYYRSINVCINKKTQEITANDFI